MTAFVAIPRAAAQQLLDDLHARIDSAHLTDVPMFPGIAELRDALAVGDTPTRHWPAQLTPVLREVLGLMCFKLGPAAHVYQAAAEFVDGEGAPLQRRAEDEQAFMLHKIVGIALAHGEAWPDLVQADLNRVKAIAAARKADTKA